MSALPPTNIQAVAEAAGVAVSTVSRVLNGGQASARAKQRVHAAVLSLGYSPSATARNLKLGKTGIVGLAGASSQGPWFTALLGGMERQLIRHASSVAIASLEVDGVYDPSPVVHWIESRRIDSLALVRPGVRELELAERAQRSGIVVAHVLPDQPVHSGFWIAADNKNGGSLAADHLRKLGHTRLAFFGGPSGSIDTHDRLAGVRARLAEDGLHLPEECVQFLPDYEMRSGSLAARRWLSESHLRSSTAVVLGNDAIALGFLREVQAAGLSVPRDVSVVGFDGISAGEFSWPSLTTVAQPTSQMGEDVALQLLQPAANGASGSTPPKLGLSNHAKHSSADSVVPRRYQLQLVIRESTAPPTRDRP